MGSLIKKRRKRMRKKKHKKMLKRTRWQRRRHGSRTAAVATGPASVRDLKRERPPYGAVVPRAGP